MKLPHLICSFGCAKRIVALIVNTVVSFKCSVFLEQTCLLERSLSPSHLHLAPADISPQPAQWRPDLKVAECAWKESGSIRLSALCPRLRKVNWFVRRGPWSIFHDQPVLWTLSYGFSVGHPDCRKRPDHTVSCYCLGTWTLNSPPNKPQFLLTKVT